MIKLTSGSFTDPNAEAWQRLQVAIVRQAVVDYKNALRTALRQAKRDGRISNVTVWKIEDCERFFRSEWCAWLCGDIINGEEIMKRVKAEVYE